MEHSPPPTTQILSLLIPVSWVSMGILLGRLALSPCVCVPLCLTLPQVVGLPDLTNKPCKFNWTACFIWQPDLVYLSQSMTIACSYFPFPTRLQSFQDIDLVNTVPHFIK